MTKTKRGFVGISGDNLKILERAATETDPANLTIGNMTVGMYLDIVRKGMLQVCPDLPMDPVKSYSAFADGRHFGLLDIDRNSPAEFTKWYHKYAHRGGHPFEIYYNVMHLWVLSDKGFYLRLAGNNTKHHVPVILKAYKGLRDADIPFEFADRKLITDIFQKSMKR